MSRFEKMLSEKSYILADGATGTNLFNMGLQSGDAPELWNVDAPEKIEKLYSLAVDAGSDLFLTNSFGGNSSRLKLHNAQDRVRELNIAAAKIGRKVAENETNRSGREVIVAGSIGPTGEIMGAAGTLSHEDAKAMFSEQAKALLEGGADVLWLETISSSEEYLAAADAFAELGAPWVGTMSFDTAGRTMMGIKPSALVELIKGLSHKPLAFGANCGVGASDLLRTISGFADAREALGIEIPIISKGDAGIPKYVDGAIVYDGTPELMGNYALIARDLGAQIIGGCCGTMPEHLVAMRARLDFSPNGPRPSFDDIQSKIGGFSSPTDGEGEDATPKRDGRRRGRGKIT